MNPIDFISKTVGQKMVVAVSGLLLALFVLGHMLGNMQIFLGPEALNTYAHHLKSQPLLLWGARFGLLGILIVHVFFAIGLARQNRLARPKGYAVEATVQASLASRSMALSGLAVFFFIVYHLAHFTVGSIHPELLTLVDAMGHQDVYSMVVISFQNVWMATFYWLAMLFLCLHLSHGVFSLFQTIGVASNKTYRLFRGIAIFYSTFIFLGNSLIVAACYFGYLKPLGGAW